MSADFATEVTAKASGALFSLGIWRESSSVIVQLTESCA
jgi:hypothetical protein